MDKSIYIREQVIEKSSEVLNEYYASNLNKRLRSIYLNSMY